MKRWGSRHAWGCRAALAALAAGAGIQFDVMTAAEPRKASPPSSFSVHWIPSPDHTNEWWVEARGFDSSLIRQLRAAAWNDAKWPQAFPVVAEPGDLMANVGLPPMLGQYQIVGSTIRFQPRFPLQPGVSYQASLFPGRLPGRNVSAGANPVVALLRVPLPKLVPSTVVQEIYPTASELPENLLKFYLEFSAPMSGGRIYDHIRLLNEAGKAVELPFLEIEEELWDRSMTRLTLFIDPGRIKRGVTPLEEIGPALETGRRFTLVIDSDWLDARGAPLKSGRLKSFRVGPANRSALNPNAWILQAPAAGATDPLVVRFDRPMDWALSRRVIQVRQGDRETLVAGSVALGSEEREWRFTPAQPWTRGPGVVTIEHTLEDLAGNNIGKSFEVDLFEGVQRRLTNAISRISFAIK